MFIPTDFYFLVNEQLYQLQHTHGSAVSKTELL